MPLNIPNAPTISAVTPVGFTITVVPDGNPGGTFYSFQVVTGVTTLYVTDLGILQSAEVRWPLSSLSVVSAAPNTLYSVALAASSDSFGTGETSFGPASDVVTSANLPVALPFSAIFSTQVTASWTANSNPVGTLYVVELSQDPGFLTGVVSSGPITTTSHTFTSLEPTTLYYAQVKAINAAAVSTAFVSLGSVTTAAGPAVIRTLDVTNLLADRGFLLEWTPSLEPNIAYYKVYRSSSPTDNSSFTQIQTTALNVTQAIDNVPFTFGLTWYYKVTAVDTGGNEGSLVDTTPVNDMSFHSFEEQPFPTTVSQGDFVNGEIPAGTVDGVNASFATAFIYRLNSLQVLVNNLAKTRGIDFNETSSQKTFTFFTVPATSVTAAAQATSTLTVSSFAGISGSATITINGHVYTNGVDWTAATSDNATATSIAAIATLPAGITASALGAVVTFTNTAFGTVGNSNTISSSDSVRLTVVAWAGGIDALLTKVAHGLTTGATGQMLTSGTLPTGLSTLTDYFVIVVSADTFKLASSLSNAFSGIGIEWTSTGTGTQTFTTAPEAFSTIRVNYIRQ